MNKQIIKLINKLLKLCDSDGYKVLEYRQLSDVKVEDLQKDLEYLKEHEYIDVKYSDESVVCLSVLNKAKQIEEQSDIKRFSVSQITKMIFLSGLFSGIMAFIGAFVAILIIKWGWKMISKKEKVLMKYIFKKCEGKESILISPEELENQLKPKYEVTRKELEQLIDGLVLDRYITMILSDKKGKPIYCISLDKKGESFERDLETERKTLIKLVVRTILLAVLSTAVGIILKLIF